MREAFILFIIFTFYDCRTKAHNIEMHDKNGKHQINLDYNTLQRGILIHAF